MIKLIILSFFICFSLISKEHTLNQKHELAVCNIFQDNAPYFNEWIEFHLANGVEHFYLYDNLSKDDWKSCLEPYQKAGIVDVVDWPYEWIQPVDWCNIQCGAYLDCISKNKNTCKWIAFIDTDEFLFSPTGENLRSVLSQYVQYPAVSVNWVIYGTSHVKKILPHEKMLDKLVWRGPLDNLGNNHVKTIAQPEFVAHCINQHNFIYTHSHSVTENFDRIDGYFSGFVSVKILRINHYWLRDLHFFKETFSLRKKRKGKTDEELEVIKKLYNDEYDPILSNL